MNKTIHIREAVTPEEVERFWQELHAYHARDIFPDAFASRTSISSIAL